MKKARVLLLNPPTAAVSTAPLLNLAYLASSLRKAGHEAKVIDATAPYKPYTAEAIKKVITEFKPDFIGITLTIVYIPQTYLYMKDLRKMRTPIVAGGPHANSLPAEVLENGADIVAIGEGEETIVELAEYFLGNKSLNSIVGVCFKDRDGKFFYAPKRKLIEDLDSIPFPDFGDFPIKNYTGSEDVNTNPIFWSVFTSRGCPYNCIFCSSHNVFGRIVRLRSARNVFDEIKSLVDRFGVEKITFQDDEILCSKKRFLELCDIITNSNLKIKMSIRTRIDSIDKEILLKAKKAGLTRMSFGIESWNDETLKKINKKYTVETIHEKFKAIEETRFPYISFNNICGFPWETKGHLRKNLKEISKIPKSISYFSTVATPIPFPKTDLYDLYHKEFDFTGWWLNPKNHPPVFSDKKRPFFIHFVSMMVPLYKPDIFWTYSQKIQKEVDRFSWKIFELFSRRHFRFYEYILIIFLCRASWFFWKLSPNLEYLLFGFLSRNSKILKLKEEIAFISKY